MTYLERINGPDDIKKLNDDEVLLLAEEVRRFMVEQVAKTGGHLAPSLGVVELVVAMCRVFDFTEDRVVFDVGHQSYAFKILTGRKEAFATLRQWGGLSGFPKGEESPYDAFDTGHSSTSVSAALGLAVARDLKGEDYRVISVIGDGALTGGMAYEAMNNAGSREEDLIVILNDNQMSISRNVGAMANYLARVRTGPNYSRHKQKAKKILKRTSGGTKLLSGLRRIRDSIKYLMVQGMFFEEMGFTYLGPIDGHDVEAIERNLHYCKNVRGPVLLHVLTKKGKGYSYAESEPDQFHGIAPFDPQCGKLLCPPSAKCFSEAFGEKLCDLAALDQRILAITAAMPGGTGLMPFAQKYRERFFDVGIAEPHAVTYAAGLAKNGMKPCFAVYSSFLQRSIDQVYHDVCLQKLPVVFGIDRAGVVGEDGETHQGIYDIALLRELPYLTLLAPSTEKELGEMLAYAFALNAPCALRYPKGAMSSWDLDFTHQPLTPGQGEMVKEGKDVLLLPLGMMMEEAIKAQEMLKDNGIDAGIFNPRFIKPLNEGDILALAKTYPYFVTIEDHVLSGGFGSAVAEVLCRGNAAVRLKAIGLPDEAIPQGHRDEVLAHYGLCAAGIAETVMAFVRQKP
ncbi:MAG TPA: 1-deoxy-D-xylulose-5-phosphate synthase [Clostridiales bacterium]|nr:1-deoxy-D-xylulose-5-phosphate synthase [Clostridiales bacterium]